MHVYFANRDGKVLYSTSSGLPGNSNILSDSIEASIESGVKTLTLTLRSDEEARKNVVVGNLVMLGGKLDYSLFTIMEVEHNAADCTMSIYGEDAGIDLINKLVNAWNPTAEQTIVSAMKSVLSYSESTGLYDGWNVNYGISTTKTIGASSFEFSNEDTALARMLSIVDIFDAEVFFSYEIDGLHLIRRNINIVKKIGEKPDFKIFRLGEDISNIVERISINDVATAFSLYGKDGNGSKKKLSSLTGYSTYENMVIEPDDKSIFTGDRKHRYKVVGNEVRCLDGMDRWKSTLDSDGKIVRVKETESKTAKLCISYAMKELEKVVDEDAEYTVEFSNAPDVGVGEYIKIVDANDRLYLQARVIEWKRSIIDNTFDCTIGGFKRLYSSKAELITNIEAVFQAISEIETVAQEAKTTADGAYDYADGVGTSAVNTAKGYTDGEVSGLKDYVDSADSTLTQYVDGIKDDLQSQIDGNITTWFYNYVPTTSNVPASNWTTTALKNEHLGDLFFNTSTGYCYRYMLDGSTYKWQIIQDTDITEALQKAQDAQDTADNKRRVFFNQPVPPYDAGDLWTQGSTGDILRCTTSRTSGSYVASDWVLASKYTDNTAVDELKEYVDNQDDTIKTFAENITNAMKGASGVGKYKLIYHDPTTEDYPVGFEIYNSSDVNKFWRFDYNGLRFTSDGGTTFSLAIDLNGNVLASNLVANAVLTNALTANNLTITGGKIEINTAESNFKIELGNGTGQEVIIDGDGYHFFSDAVAGYNQIVTHVGETIKSESIDVDGVRQILSKISTSGRYRLLQIMAENIQLSGIDDTDTVVSVIGELYVNDEKVSVEGHQHTASDVTDMAVHIVESGTSNNWTYMKYSDGRMQAFRHPTRNIDFSSALGSYIHYHNDMSYALPEGFLEAPTVIVCGNGGREIIFTVNDVTTTSFLLNAVMFTSTSSPSVSSYRISMMAEGTWK